MLFKGNRKRISLLHEIFSSRNREVLRVCRKIFDFTKTHIGICKDFNQILPKILKYELIFEFKCCQNHLRGHSNIFLIIFLDFWCLFSLETKFLGSWQR